MNAQLDHDMADGEHAYNEVDFLLEGVQIDEELDPSAPQVAGTATPASALPPPGQAQSIVAGQPTSTASSSSTASSGSSAGKEGQSASHRLPSMSPPQQSRPQHLGHRGASHHPGASQSRPPPADSLQTAKAKWLALHVEVDAAMPGPQAKPFRVPSSQAGRQTLAPPAKPDLSQAPTLSATLNSESTATAAPAANPASAPELPNIYSQARQRRYASSQATSSNARSSEEPCIDTRELTIQETENTLVTIDDESLRSDTDQLGSQPFAKPQDDANKPAPAASPQHERAATSSSAQPGLPASDGDDSGEVTKVPGSPPSRATPEPRKQMTPPTATHAQQHTSSAEPRRSDERNKATADDVHCDRRSTPGPARTSQESRMQADQAAAPAQEQVPAKAPLGSERLEALATPPASPSHDVAEPEREPLPPPESAKAASNIILPPVFGPAESSHADHAPPPDDEESQAGSSTQPASRQPASRQDSPQQPALEADGVADDALQHPPSDRHLTFSLKAAAYSRPYEGSDGTDLTQLTIRRNAEASMLSYREQRKVLQAEIALLKRIRVDVRTIMAERARDLDALDEEEDAQQRREKKKKRQGRRQVSPDDQMYVDASNERDDEESDAGTAEEDEDQLDSVADDDDDDDSRERSRSKQRGPKHHRKDDDSHKFAKPSLPSHGGRQHARAGPSRKPPVPMPKAGPSRAAKFLNEVRPKGKQSAARGGKASPKATPTSSTARKRVHEVERAESSTTSSGSSNDDDDEVEDESQASDESDQPAQPVRSGSKKLKKRAPVKDDDDDEAGFDTEKRPAKKRIVVDLTEDLLPPPGRERALAIQKKREAKSNKKSSSRHESDEDDENMEPDPSASCGVRKSSRRNNRPIASYAQTGDYSQSTGLWRAKTGRSRSGTR